VSQPETPAITDIDRLILAQEETQRKLDVLTDAVNGLGANVQWIIENVQGIFQMFSNPSFMANLPAMMGGGNAQE
jgi:hypothetical protein